ncbi:PDR/VanB family oxidoreductase [Azospirillum halopraeferens]|uniref:PDR/VanB family oxidoreductase n=1 Tax=Azospirillum halopraeferens TaxID=34010 RepID=UPI00048C72CD|nr:PDR/VanB family oxidoreductase [Azospirillum halopraeferens]
MSMETPPGTLTLRAERVACIAPGVVSVLLRDPRGAALPPAEPGAHIDLHLPDGGVRSYSLCGDPADRHAYTIAVLAVPGGRGSGFVHGALRPGTVVTVSGPRNSFRFDPSPRYLFVAGGIGITPLLPMAREAARRGADWTLHHCVRSAAGAPLRDELAAIGGGRVVVHAADAGDRLAVDALLASPVPDTLVYCCGPQRLMDAVATAAVAAAWPAGSVRFEWFTPPAGDVADAGDAAADGAFEVVCARTGVSVTVPEGTSVLEALDAAGVRVDSSCEQGICGTCETAVLEGEPDHRDSVLSDAERAAGRTMMICVSRARSARLVLDV